MSKMSSSKPRARSSKVNMAGNYTKPKLRKDLFFKIKSGSKGGSAGQWSARKAQLLTKQYESAGGGYTMGFKKSQKSLRNWTDEDWDYVSKSDSKKPRKMRGRYLPKEVRMKLTPSQKKSTNMKKRKAGGVGTRVSYSKRIAKMVNETRSSKK